MAGILPDGGVPPEQAQGADPNVELTDECRALFYSTNRCPPRFDPRAMNALLSEIINLVNQCEGKEYDCTKLTNLAEAVQCIADDAIFGCMAQNFPTADGACTIEQLVLITDETGCRKIARYSSASAEIARVTSASVYGPDHNIFIPNNPGDPSSYYDRTSLSQDIVNNSVDEGKLNTTKVFEMNLFLECASRVNFLAQITNVFEPNANGGNGRAAELVMRIDGEWQVTGSDTVSRRFAATTNFVGAMRGEIALPLSAGGHTVEVFLIRPTGSSGASQASQIHAIRSALSGATSASMTASLAFSG